MLLVGGLRYRHCTAMLVGSLASVESATDQGATAQARIVSFLFLGQVSL
jgi:microcompartment protein CcmL/EutN